MIIITVLKIVSIAKITQQIRCFQLFPFTCSSRVRHIHCTEKCVVTADCRFSCPAVVFCWVSLMLWPIATGQHITGHMHTSYNTF